MHMRKTTKLFFLPLMAMMLTSCDILGAIRGITGLKPKYENYEEFFADAMHFKSGTTFDLVMKNINKELRYWTRHTSQYSSTKYSIVEAPFFETINEYSDHYTIYLTNHDNVTIQKEAKQDGSIIEIHTNSVPMLVDGENHKWRYGDTTKDEKHLDEKSKASINVYADENGYLVVSNSNSIFYITKDLKKVYFNDSNTRTFRYMTDKDEYDSVQVPESDALTAALETSKNSRPTLALPKPNNDSSLDKNKYWYGYNYRNIDLFGQVDPKKEDYINGYNLYFPGIEAYTYSEQLKQQGWTIHRANDEDLIATTSQKYDSYWVAVDEAEQYKIIIHDFQSLYVDLNALFTDGPSHSTRVEINRLGGIEKVVAGRKTTKTDWTDREKRTMRKWYDLDVELPFVALSDSYSVPLRNSSAYAGLYSNLMELGTKCFNIQDNHYKYLLDGYGEVLEANGFTKFEMPSSVNPDDYKTVYEWYKVDSHKLYNAYVNYDKDVAVRFYFDISEGNVIRFFRISTMKAWDPNRDPDTTDYDALEDPDITVNPDE